MKAFADAVDLTTLGAARDCPSARVRLTPYRPTLQAAGDGTEITSTVTNTTAITQVSTRLDLPDGWSAAPAGSTRTLRVPINHPTCSGGMLVLAKVSAEPVSSVDLQ
ncbi:hypothetical protein ACFC0I_44335, partial [Streptomyces sp. NPDC056227]